jgi:hypothetical protein
VQYLATFIISVATFIIGCYLRRKRGKAIDRQFANKLALAAGGIGGSAGGMVLPTVWLLVSWAVRGGSWQDNLPPGFELSFIMTVLPLGGALLLLHAVFSFIEHLDSE